MSLLYSIADSASIDGESGFEEAEVSEVSAGVTKVISRFIEKVSIQSFYTFDAHTQAARW